MICTYKSYIDEFLFNVLKKEGKEFLNKYQYMEYLLSDSLAF